MVLFSVVLYGVFVTILNHLKSYMSYLLIRIIQLANVL